MIMDSDNRLSSVSNKEGSMLDVASTILPLLGYTNSFGLGRNLLGNEISLLTEFGNFNDQMDSWQSSISKFWNFPQIKEDIFIDKNKGKLSIGKHSYTYPLLLTYNQNKEITPYFDFSSPKTLSEYKADLKNKTPFIWVDECSKLHPYLNELPLSDDYCLLKGKIGGRLTGSHLKENTYIPYRLIQRYSAPDITPYIFATDTNRFIAHAGGAIEGNAYTCCAACPETQSVAHSLTWQV